MLLGLWGVATTWCAGCQLGETLPPRPVVPPREALVNQQASDGCTRFALKVVNGVARVEALYNTNGCHTDELQLLADSAPTYTAATGTLRVPIVLKNVGGVAVMAPARIRFNADSSQFLNAQGQVIAGTPNILATNYDTANAGGRNGQWRYDTVLAVSGQPQLLLPGASSRRKWLEFTGSDWTQAVRIKVPTVATQVGGVVPAVPPDSTPDEVFADSNFVADTSYAAVPFLRNAVTVVFQQGTSQAAKQALIDSVGGVVVGGERFSTTEGYYVVRAVSVVTTAQLLALRLRLVGSNAVEEAHLVFKNITRPASLFPNDGPTWRVWRSLLPSGAQQSFALERIRAPLAWGCSTGSATTPIAIVDADLRSTSDLVVNVGKSHGIGAAPLPSSGPVSYPWEHGTHVASILAATGNNTFGMTGISWQSDFRFREYFPFGLKTTSQSTVAQIELAVRDGARIVNFSSDASHFWAYNPTKKSDSVIVFPLDTLLENAIARLKRKNLDPLIIVSAGDFIGTAVTTRDPFWAGYAAAKRRFPDNILVVGSVSKFSLDLTPTSGRGTLVSVAATGESIWGLDSQNPSGAPRTGISYALPQVAGVAGLLLAFDPSLTAHDLVQLVDSGAKLGGRVATGVPVLDAYESLKLAAARPGAPLCGNPIAYTAAVDTINSTSTITVNAKRVAGPGGFEPLTTFSVPGTNGAPVYLPHGGKQILVDLGDGLGLHRVAQHNGTSWQTLAAPWPIATDSSVSGVTWSSRGWTHGGDTAFYAIKTANPGFLTSNVSFALWSNGSLGSPLTTKPDLADRWTPIGGTLSTGAAGFGGTISPTGTFGIGFVTDGGAVKSYRFYKISVPSGADSLLFTDVLDIDPAYPATYSGPAPALGLTISEDGSEFWYTAPVQNSSYYYGCILKRYSLTLRQFVSVDALPSGGSLSACTPTSLAWQGAAARTAGRRLRP